MAELAYQISEGSTAEDAIVWARDAAVYSTFYLAEPTDSHCNEPVRCFARAIHNRAVARCLRLAQTDVAPARSAWPAQLAQAGILPTSTWAGWSTLGVDSLQATDRVTGRGKSQSELRGGLGVPLIVHRGLTDRDLAEWKAYGPGKVVFAATAVLKPRGSVTTWRNQPVELLLVDPFQVEALELGGTLYPLAQDLTTPLALRLAQSSMRNYEFLGVVNPRLYAAHAGVYPVDPYQPGKVPVVFVQGLWTGPGVWGPMLDALRKDPMLRASCQFWVVLYPSGYPLPLAARSLRQSLREIRQRFDPNRVDPALDQMVILGKSTGGQVAKMLAAPSGDGIWNAVFSQPLEKIQARPELRADLACAFFYQPEPYVRRVIFVATGHRGSKLAKQPGLRLGVELIRRNNPLRQVCAELEVVNSPLVFQPFFRNRIPSSIDGMQANDPLLVALEAQPISPRVAYHSIIARRRRRSLQPLEKSSDGLVDYSSTHLDGAASECIVSAGHMCEADPEVIREVQRILTLHVSEAAGLRQP
ncbi:MAG: esterase/lipase family protein [Isosphaeraceae bacterium]